MVPGTKPTRHELLRRGTGPTESRPLWENCGKLTSYPRNAAQSTGSTAAAQIMSCMVVKTCPSYAIVNATLTAKKVLPLFNGVSICLHVTQGNVSLAINEPRRKHEDPAHVL